MFKKLIGILKNVFKKEDKTNFNQSIKNIEKLIARSKFDLALVSLEETLNVENKFLEENPSVDNIKKQYLKKKTKIEKLKYTAELKMATKQIKLLLYAIKDDFNNKVYENINGNLENLKKNYIDKWKEFKYLNTFHNTVVKKLKKIEIKANTQNVNSFEDLVSKIEDLMSLGKFDVAEEGLLEVKSKETKKFEESKNNHEISRKKIKQLESIYNKRIATLDKTLNKLFVLRNKYLQKKKEEDLKKVFSNTKYELNNLMKGNDLYTVKDYIEKKIRDNKGNKDNVNLISYLNKKGKIISSKIKNKEKSQSRQLNTVEEVNKLLALEGEETDNEIIDLDLKLKDNKFLYYSTKIKRKISKISEFFVAKGHKKTLDDLDYLLGTNSGGEADIIKKYHTGMTKFLTGTKINGYNFFGQVIGADKITGDTFVVQEKKDRYWFSVGDATGHGAKAGLIVSKFTKLFLDTYNDFEKVEYFAMELNNKLKGTLQSGNFLTCLLFEISKEKPSVLKVIGMGHEPLYVYRKYKRIVEEYRFIGLAGGIRKILKIENVKINNIILDEGDIVVSYTDGIIEAKSPDGKMYGLERFKQIFLKASNEFNDLKKIYDYMLKDLRDYSGRINYDDDVTIILLSRNSKTDLVSAEQLQSIISHLDFKVNMKDLDEKKIKGKTKEELIEELKKENLKKELDIILLRLDDLYKDGEIVKLKDEAYKYIKSGYVSAKIIKYLKKALEMENAYKISVKNQKIMIKYNTLIALYTKGDYKTVIKEAYDVIVKNGNL